MHQLEEKQETSLKEQVKRSTREISYLTTVFTEVWDYAFSSLHHGGSFGKSGF